MLAIPRIAIVALLLPALLAGCPRDREQPSRAERQARAEVRAGVVTVSGDDSLSQTLTWRAPAVQIAEGEQARTRKRAEAALKAGRLFADADSAIPLYLALAKRDPGDKAAQAGLRRALRDLLADGERALARSDEDIEALRRTHDVAAVARVVDGDDEQVQAFLARVDSADTLWELNRDGEHALANARYGEALAKFREALALEPRQPRAMQGVAAVESALIRRAELAGEDGDFASAQRWLADAAKLRPDIGTVPDARARIERMRSARIARLRDAGIAALPQMNGVAEARKRLAEMLLIAKPGDPVAAELRERIDLAQHYGLYRPGQTFTDAIKHGGRGPQMVVLPHGAFRMGSADGDRLGVDNERPQRNIRFDRGFAMSATEVTVGEFRRFVNATGRRTRAMRRGFSMAYDERSGNFARRSHVDWSSDYAGRPAADDQPVLHVSAKDADAYAHWLTEQTGKHYRLPSEAEFEYALRAGGSGIWPWGDGAPPANAGNFTGARDVSPHGTRRWNNAFAGYGDTYWGPAPVRRFKPNAWGLHDLSGNVGEWVADCWHDTYRRAPKDGAAWVNPGCRTRVIRGGSWASSPEQTRSAWRAPAGVDNTNARVGFRVVRDI
nr:formylglycine-generating enzyme family protein [Luteimonas aquatica]